MSKGYEACRKCPLANKNSSQCNSCSYSDRDKIMDNDDDFMDALAGFAISAAVGGMTDSSILGAVVGGDYLGGIVGDSLFGSDDDDSIFW